MANCRGQLSSESFDWRAVDLRGADVRRANIKGNDEHAFAAFTSNKQRKRHPTRSLLALQSLAFSEKTAHADEPMRISRMGGGTRTMMPTSERRTSLVKLVTRSLTRC